MWWVQLRDSGDKALRCQAIGPLRLWANEGETRQTIFGWAKVERERLRIIKLVGCSMPREGKKKNSDIKLVLEQPTSISHNNAFTSSIASADLHISFRPIVITRASLFSGVSLRTRPTICQSSYSLSGLTTTTKPTIPSRPYV